MISGHSVAYNISDFLKRSENDIVGELNDPSRQTQAFRVFSIFLLTVIPVIYGLNLTN